MASFPPAAALCFEVRRKDEEKRGEEKGPLELVSRFRANTDVHTHIHMDLEWACFVTKKGCGSRSEETLVRGLFRANDARR